MRNRILFALAAIGVLAGLTSAALFAVRSRPLSPVFAPAANPYEHGVYANGIVESLQESGENINVYPEVGGTVTEILVHEGSRVARGAPLVRLDDSVQRATAEQQQAQAEAALAMLEELRAQPRPENLEVALAQVASARASLKSADDDRAKQQKAYDTMPDSVSKMVLDQAINATELAPSEPRRRAAKLRAREGRRMELRHPQSGGPVQCIGEGSSRRARSSRQVHDRRTGGRGDL